MGQKHFGAEKIKVKNILVIKISGKNFFGSNKFLHEKKVWVLQFFCQKNSGMGKKYLGLPKKDLGPTYFCIKMIWVLIFCHKKVLVGLNQGGGN